jgi:hypothetical protein
LLPLAGVFVLIGLYMLQPNQAAILNRFGCCAGTDRQIAVRDGKRKAAVVSSNLLVVLCSDKDTQPIVNTGTLYS